MPICKTFLSYTLLYMKIDPNVNEKPVRKNTSIYYTYRKNIYYNDYILSPNRILDMILRQR